ncbi:MAG: acetoacetate--CoA ligase, partial [Marinospirillum sp.]|nr:acetoacetate--CoA ligase [Marinospirillum sp.]
MTYVPQIQPQPLWQPTAATIKDSPLSAFMQRVNDRYQQHLLHYADLHQWSVVNPEEFWELMWEFGEVVAAEQGSQVLE